MAGPVDMLKRPAAGVPLRTLAPGARFVLLRTGQTFRLLARQHARGRFRYVVAREGGGALFSDLSHQCRVQPIPADTMSTDPTLDSLFVRNCVAQLIAACHGAALAGGWWNDLATGEPLTFAYRPGMPRADQKRNIGELLCLVHSELSEAMEGARKGSMDDKLPHRPMLEVELADALIRIFDMAGGLGLDLPGALAEKLAYNAQRADHKPENRRAAGGKAF